MKKLILFSVCISVAIATAPVWGVGEYNVTFNENGQGDNGGVPMQKGTGVPSIGQSELEKIPTLFYVLGFTPAIQGDVKILEPQTSTISDVLRFVGDKVYVYSEKETGEQNAELADVVTNFPQWEWWQTPVVTEYETGLHADPYTELVNGLYWQPREGEPGFNGVGNELAIYTFISDVPEPATLALLAIGGLAMLRRNKK
ncbi:MAG: PEP-CTERM sorting domain-containing protein [Planctomycetota bacterium]|nr:PEP-CTERM sorting domain-containing protein [Planctomycetota bacterium]